MGVIFTSLLGFEAVLKKVGGIKLTFLRMNARGSLQNDVALETAVLKEAEHAKNPRTANISIAAGAPAILALRFAELNTAGAER